MNPLITVPIPTVAGREKHLERMIASLKETANVEILVFKDFPGCGPVWARGADQASGDYILFGADDTEMHPGWWEAAVEVCDRGFLPAPRVLNTDGSLQSCGGSDGWETEHETGHHTDFSRGPFVSKELWQKIRALAVPFLEKTHYYTDNAISLACEYHGVLTGVHRDFLYTHHLASVKRGADRSWEQRMAHDGRLFQAFAQYVSFLHAH